MMRAWSLTCLLLACGSASALAPAAYPHLMEFRDALAAYQRGEHAVARPAFRHLAELGDPEARFNLGVMLLRGEGGDEAPAEGYAWVRWAAEAGLDAASAALPAIEAALDVGERAASEAVLAELRERHGLDRLLPGPEFDRWGDGCVVRNMQRVEPRYPARAAQARQIGYAELHFLLNPTGEVEAVHAMPSLVRDDPFAEAAVRAVRRWSARDCPSSDFRHLRQVILFDLHGRTDYGREAKAWAEAMLAEARAGGGAQAYAVALVDRLLPGLFELAPGERRDLMLRAAVAGVADAREHLGLWLEHAAPEHAARWRLLAARQGHGPALLWAARSNRLDPAERRQALLRAAGEGFLPAVLLAVRELATHPDAERRDAVAALRITSALPERLRREDPSMGQAHAAALAENGQFQEAAQWEQRALRAARRAGRDAGPFEQRLAAYRAGRAWRDAVPVTDDCGDVEVAPAP
jgi:TonB family protein